MRADWPAAKGSRLLASTFVLVTASVLPVSAQAQTRAAELAAPGTRSQAPAAPSQSQSGPLTLTLQDALARAQKNDKEFLSVLSDAQVAHEDAVQARASLLPSVGLRSEYLGTEGNGVFPSGRYVTNDGVHVYRDWAVLHQDVSGALMRTTYQRAEAAAAIARAKTEIAKRGLNITVTKAYYALVTAQRKYATAQQALDQAQHYLTVSQDQERGGEVAHSDVVKAQLQVAGQEQAFREAKLSMATARLDLAVLLFRDFNQNFEVVDDLHLAPVLPPFTDLEGMAERQNPDLKMAADALRAANLDVRIAREAFLPTITFEADYGIEANAFALHSTVASDPRAGVQPNLGYFVTGSLNLPVWDWGGRRSKLTQAHLKRDQASVELSAAQRQMLRNLNAFYGEAQTARDQAESLRRTTDLAAESLRLNGLRYQAGEATILELVDAQTTLTQARNAYDDGLARYRVALASLQSITGSF